MSTIATNTLFGVPPVPTRRFSVAEYHQMVDAGILTEDDRVELLEGWIVAKVPRRPAHDGTVQVVNQAVTAVVPVGWTVRIQSAIVTGDSEPEPDLAVVRGSERSYLQRHPQPADIGTLIEVSETTLNQDRQQKGCVYARATIPCYWIVNLVDRCIEVYTDPDSTSAVPRYRSRTDYRSGDVIPLTLDGQVVASLAVDDLLP